MTKLGDRFRYGRGRVHVVVHVDKPGSGGYDPADGPRVGVAACGVVANDGQADYVDEGNLGGPGPWAEVDCRRCAE